MKSGKSRRQKRRIVYFKQPLLDHIANWGKQMMAAVFQKSPLINWIKGSKHKRRKESRGYLHGK